jgi:hypothetical protein
MSEPRAGLYWHCHHDCLVEWVHNYQERVEYIERAKPEDEIGARLRLFRPVRGPVPVEIIEACMVREQARETWDRRHEQWQISSRAYSAAWERDATGGEARKLWSDDSKAWMAASRSWIAADENLDALLDDKHRAAIEALHAVECPDCPWDGKTIFPTQEEQEP